MLEGGGKENARVSGFSPPLSFSLYLSHSLSFSLPPFSGCEAACGPVRA